MHEIVDQILSYVKATWRYRWYAVAAAWLIAVVGWVVVHRMPDRYAASARVFVDTQTVLRPLLAGLAVQPNVDQLVGMMSRTLITRPNLEKVIRMSDMEIKNKNPEDREQMVNRLFSQLTIRSAGRDNLYTISYADENPQDAKRLVQSLLTIFVEGSLGDKRKDADSARRFIDAQIKAYAERLAAAEDAVTEFKRKNMGLMGNQANSYYSRLEGAKNAQNQAVLELSEAENSRDALKRQLSGDEAPILLGDPEASDVIANPQIDARIQGFQQKLDALRLNFTEQHPDIIAISRIMEQLKEQRDREVREIREARARDAKLKKPSAPRFQQNPVSQQLSVSFAEAEARVASLKARVAEYDKRYNALKGMVNAVPQVEAEYTQLTRGYEILRKNYDALLARSESAQMAGDMEDSASVMDFRVIDPPQVSSKPSAPNRPFLISMILLGAIAGGVGFAFLISQLRPTFHNERRLQEVSDLPVYGTVAMVWTPSQKRSRKKRLVAFLLSFLSLLSAYAALMMTLVFTASRA